MENKKTFKRVLYTAVICLLACSLVVGVSFVAGAANVGRDNEVSGGLWADLDQEVHLISTKAELVDWARDPHAKKYEGKVIALGADITFNEGKNAADWASAAPAEKWTPVMNFAGVFDGRGHTISGLYYVNASASDIGFFGFLEKGAVVRNLSVKNSYFKGSYHVGSVAGSSRTATFTNLYSNAIIETVNSNAGGIVGSLNADGGYASNVMVTSCWFDGTINCAAMYASGIVGNQNHNHTVITDCLNTGSVTATTSHAAGISGAVYNGTLTATRCVNLGKCVDAVTRTVGNNKAQNTYLVDCFAKTSAVTNLQPTDIRGGTIVEGTVVGLADSFTAADLEALSGSWKMNGSIPVPEYFAAKDAAQIPAAEGEKVFTPTVSVESVQAIVDGKVSVVLSLKGNQGISDMNLKINYDASVLTLAEVIDGGVLNGATEAVLTNPLELVWSSDVNSAANGTLTTLVFDVNKAAAVGTETVVSVAYAEANSAAGTKVVLDAVDGKVSVTAAEVGDANGDFVIDSKDASVLMQYLAGEGVEILLSAADTNGDGTVNQADADLLAQYLAGQNVTLG